MDNPTRRTICEGCFKDPGPDPACAHCDLGGSRLRPDDALPIGYELCGRYTLGNVLGKGGFAFTYLARDKSSLQRLVAIKEYFPHEATRDEDDIRMVPKKSKSKDEFKKNERLLDEGLRAFLMEARLVVQFDHRNIVNVIDLFEDKNGTAYMLMPYYEGRTLEDVLDEMNVVPGDLYCEETQALAWIVPVLDALQYVHERNYQHLDIKPDNIYITDEDCPKLIDFGAARLEHEGKSTRLQDDVGTPGYSPLELYPEHYEKEPRGPWSDVYSCAATLYRMLTGITLPPANERAQRDALQPLRQIRPEISEDVSTAIMEGLTVYPRTRRDLFKDAQAFKERLFKSVSQPPPDTGSPIPPEPRPPKPRRRMVAVASVLAMIATLLLMSSLIFPSVREKIFDGKTGLPGSLRLDTLGLSMTFIHVPAGEFFMGDIDGKDDERPRKLRRITAPFYMSQHEVTRQQFGAFIEHTGYRTEVEQNGGCMVVHNGKFHPDPQANWKNASAGNSHPVVCVSWNDAQAFANWLSSLDQVFYRLPTEAEWEYAARAGTDTPYSFPGGPTNLTQYAKLPELSASGMLARTAEVQSFLPNPWRLHDMHGNVREWVSDWYDRLYYARAPYEDPPGPTSATNLRSVRGGGWYGEPSSMRVGRRSQWWRELGRFDIGFRLVSVGS